MKFRLFDLIIYVCCALIIILYPENNKKSTINISGKASSNNPISKPNTFINSIQKVRLFSSLNSESDNIPTNFHN